MTQLSAPLLPSHAHHVTERDVDDGEERTHENTLGPTVPLLVCDFPWHLGPFPSLLCSCHVGKWLECLCMCVHMWALYVFMCHMSYNVGKWALWVSRGWLSSDREMAILTVRINQWSLQMDVHTHGDERTPWPTSKPTVNLGVGESTLCQESSVPFTQPCYPHKHTLNLKTPQVWWSVLNPNHNGKYLKSDYHLSLELWNSLITSFILGFKWVGYWGAETPGVKLFIDRPQRWWFCCLYFL